jgi:hypothetical protein
MRIPKKHLRDGSKEKDAAFEAFAEDMQKAKADGGGVRWSARGWCYVLESTELPKSVFDYFEKVINDCRKDGYLPVDFTAEEEGRIWHGVEVPEMKNSGRTPVEYLKSYLSACLKCENWYTPDWWDGEKYYIQMVVEKIDLVTLFEPITEKYHIPIATAKGWSSILMRAIYARRFQEAEKRGLKCVLLYCGDFDPDGRRISDFLRSNLEDIKDIVWEDGTEGYDPVDLEIKRFGLDYDFIIENKLTWIENLITGSKKNLADPKHKNFHLEYVQSYIKKYGIRKVEANAIVKDPKLGKPLCEKAIRKYLGRDALDRFQKKRDKIVDEMNEVREKTGVNVSIKKALELIEDEE